MLILRREFFVDIHVVVRLLELLVEHLLLLVQVLEDGLVGSDHCVELLVVFPLPLLVFALFSRLADGEAEQVDKFGKQLGGNRGGK